MSDLSSNLVTEGEKAIDAELLEQQCNLALRHRGVKLL